MPRINTLDEIVAKQEAAAIKLARAKDAFNQTKLNNAIALGKLIAELRKASGLNRSQVSRVLKVTPACLYTVENPDKVPVCPTIRNQLRFYSAMKQLHCGVTDAVKAVEFKHSGRGRPRTPDLAAA